MIFNYVTYLLFCMLSEVEIMHPYGTDHAHGGLFDD